MRCISEGRWCVVSCFPFFFVCFAEWDGESAFSKSKKDTKCLYRCSFLFCDFIAIFVSVFFAQIILRGCRGGEVQQQLMLVVLTSVWRLFLRFSCNAMSLCMIIASWNGTGVVVDDRLSNDKGNKFILQNLDWWKSCFYKSGKRPKTICLKV